MGVCCLLRAAWFWLRAVWLVLALAGCGVAGCGWLRVAGGVGSGGLLLALAGCGVVLALAGQPPHCCVCTPRCQPLCGAKRDNLVVAVHVRRNQNLKRFAVRITRTGSSLEQPRTVGKTFKDAGSFDLFQFWIVFKTFVQLRLDKLLQNPGGWGGPRKVDDPVYLGNDT